MATMTQLLPPKVTLDIQMRDGSLFPGKPLSGNLNGSIKAKKLGAKSSLPSSKENHLPSIKELGPVTSGLQFEPCRFPVATTKVPEKQLDTQGYTIRPGFSLCNGALYAKRDLVLSHADSVDLIRTAWATLIHNYTRNDIVSFAEITIGVEEQSDADFVTSIVARFPPGESASTLHEGPHEISERTISMHVLKEGQINAAICFLNESTWTENEHPFDLVLLVTKTPFNTHLTLAFKPSSISNKYGVAISHTFKHIVASLASGDTRSLSSASATSPFDIRAAIGWNSAVPFEVRACLHDLVELSLLKHPLKEAVCAWNGSFTYQELWNHSSYWTQHLRNSGVRNGTLVAVAFEKSRWAVVAMLSILRAGGAIVPIDPEHPSARLKDLCLTVGAQILLTSGKYVDKMKGLVKEVVVVSALSYDYVSADIKVDPPVLSNPHDMAIVLFTSGSTGQPKAIVQEHRSACTHSRAHGEKMGYDGRRTLQFSAFTWDVAMIDIFTTLLYGGCVCIPSEADRRLDIAGAINKMGVEIAFLTPSFASLIDPDAVPGLRTLIVAGEALKQNVVCQWAKHVTLYQAYGPAEVGVCTLTHLKSTESNPENVGLPANSLCFIVDPNDHNKLMPIGATGELVVGGPTIAREYHGDLDKTSGAFFKNPPWAQHLPYKFRRFYKTGDLLKYSTRTMDGSMDFVGRIGSQIKRHGQRVEVGEVEHHISNLAAVGISMVVQPQRGCYKGELVAVVQLASRRSTQVSVPADQSIKFIATSTEGLSQSLLIKHLSEYLPRYMIPNVLLIVEDIPFSASLKLETKRVHGWLEDLQTRYRSSTENQADDEQSLSTKLKAEEEVALAINAKIADLLAKEDPDHYRRLAGRNFNLQEAGVTSIHIVSLSLFLQNLYGVKVSLPLLMSSKVTIRDLAEAVELRSAASAITGSVDALKEAAVLLDDILTDEEIKKALYQPVYGSCKSWGSVRVFLTGSTGYLGTEILHQLLDLPNVVPILLVRASDPAEALHRVVQRASKDGWWTDCYRSRIEVWPGDLTKPHFGLNPRQFASLCGKSESATSDNINVIIQNAAQVHYNLDYDTMRSTNVSSTRDLVKLGALSKHLSNLVYVSGGQQIKPSEDNDVEMSKHAEATGGYEQSKLVAELVVKRFGNELQVRNQDFSIVKPGYIIGNEDTGLGNPNDFIWRLVQGCLEIGAYNADEEDHWLFVSDKDRLAHQIVTVAFRDSNSGAQHRQSNVIKALAGMRIRDFWATLREFGYVVQPMPYKDWLGRVRGAIMTRLEAHPLYPVIHILERGSSIIGCPEIPKEPGKPMTSALKRNIEYLIEIGTLPSPQTKAG